ERGDAMYFISSGAVEVRIDPIPVQLGTGDFFGELALLVTERRNADVVALGYCQLLSLAARDFHRLFGTEPALRDQIDAVADARTAATEALCPTNNFAPRQWPRKLSVGPMPRLARSSCRYIARRRFCAIQITSIGAAAAMGAPTTRPMISRRPC